MEDKKIIIKRCSSCGYVGMCTLDYVKCNCGEGDMVPVNVSQEEFLTIRKISRDNHFFDAMLELKANDIIEYNLKMSQFRTQIEQQKANTILSDTSPQCPNCHSTMIRKIDALERAGSVAMLGIFSKKINKSFKCQKCGYTW